ncbi:MAG: response regulator, partial [Lachnospiraceae bacterium]|nr:response regulator [Lachnospiraceae bacterium]
RLMFSVSCDTNEEDKKARFKIKVSDTGCGLSQVDCNAIFGAYDTYDSRQSSNLKGIGLKFNICKDLLAMMNGDMIIRSIEGVGLESEIAFECDVVDNSPMLELIEKEKRDILIYIKDNRELETWKSIMSGFNVHPDYANSFFAFDKAISTRDYDYIFVLEESYATVAGIISTNAKEDNTYVVCSKNRLYGDFGKCRILWQPICSLSIIDALNDTWKASNYESKNEKIEYDGSEAKILVVDDNAVNLKVASGIFKGYNIEIDTAKSGSESLKKLEEKEYNLVLMDMVMPEMSGEETLKKIRESRNKAISEIPVVALTANTGGNIREEILSLGFQEYLAKPIKTRYLTQILLDFLPPGMLKRKLVDNKPSTPVVKETSKPKESLGEIKDTKIKGLVTELKEALDNMDLTLCNTLFEKFKGEDIDPGVSLKVKEIKKAYDVYDFEKIKEMISVI